MFRYSKKEKILILFIDFGGLFIIRTFFYKDK